MTEAGGNTAGGLLRAAREKQGLHIAALAAAIKVSPRKLDALENDRLAELPDATFTRALAQTVCRQLKVDARPVLDLLPAVGGAALEHARVGLNTPFRERPGRAEPGLAFAAIRPMVWAASLLMLAAVVVYFLPQGLFDRAAAPTTVSTPVATTPPASSAALAPVALPSPVTAAVGDPAADVRPAAVAGLAASQPVHAPAPLAAAGREAFFDRIVDAFGEHVVEQVGMEGRGLRAWLARRDGVRVGRVGCGVRLGGAGGGGILHADAHPGPVGALLGVGGEAAVGGAARGRAGA